MTSAPADLDVGRLRLLREVALRGTIAAAARALGLSPSAVSQQLSVLEREAGTALLDRSTRGVALTGAGRALAERADEIVNLLASARADLERLAGAVAGTVRIAAVPSVAATIVSGAVSALRIDHPEVGVCVLAAEPARSHELLAAGDVEIAVVDEYDLVPLAVPDYATATHLADEVLVAVVARGHKPDGALRLTDLAKSDWVMPPDEAACGQAVRAACRAQGFQPRVTWETDDMLLLTAAVAAGHGVAVLPRRAVMDHPDVEVRDLRKPAVARRLYALTRPSVANRPIVQRVLSALVAAAH